MTVSSMVHSSNHCWINPTFLNSTYYELAPVELMATHYSPNEIHADTLNEFLAPYSAIHSPDPI